jgi:hypothetical protein
MSNQSGDRSSRSNGSSDAPGSRYIVVLCDTVRRPDALLNGLRSRGVTPCVVTSGPQALVALRAHEADALIVDQPDSLSFTDELIEAVTTHLPSVVCWSHESIAGKSKLSKLVAPKMDVPSEPVVTVAPTQRAPIQPVPIARSVAAPSPRQLRLAGETAAYPLAHSPTHSAAHPLHELAHAPRTPETDDIDQPLITREELQMLLGPSPRSSAASASAAAINRPEGQR